MILMKLLVSPINMEEAKAVVNGGADIVDVKNPKEGSLGASFPWIISEVKNMLDDMDDGVKLSATLGDFEYKPGTASLAALGAVIAGAEYIKIGLYGVKTPSEAEDMLNAVVRSVKEHDSSRKVVAATYSDYKRVGCIPPLQLPSVAAKTGADVVMVDTGIKDGKTTFEFMTEEELTAFIDAARNHGLTVALAGSIGFEDIPTLRRMKPDIVGIRGAVCGGDRNSSIKEELVERFKNISIA